MACHIYNKPHALHIMSILRNIDLPNLLEHESSAAPEDWFGILFG